MADNSRGGGALAPISDVSHVDFDASAEHSDLDRNDFVAAREGVSFAGTHLIVDLWGASRLDDIDFIEETMRACVDAAGATLLHIHLHHFTPNQGVSGVAVLAESHISIHSWPEYEYAAMDIFMCGDAQPQRAVDVLREAFQPERVDVGEHLRGRR
ncbi:MAG: adenosylmethionine decarboxylase [Rhodospirillaceae bacterium]|jgi:S-adenosylmethionine decarboxylase|nr:adenosylmethionine decarboxylase [Rhodospirillaceae bacterium]